MEENKVLEDEIHSLKDQLKGKTQPAEKELIRREQETLRKEDNVRNVRE